MDLQWFQSDEAEKISEDAKAKAWKDFKIKYPFADISKFVAQTDFIDKKHATAEIYLKAGPGFWQSISIIILQIPYQRFNLKKILKLLEVCSIRK